MVDRITVLVERCTMEIELEPFFTQNTQENKKKLLRYVFQEPWRNEETITVLGCYLAGKAAEEKELWHTSGATYQNEYIDTKFRYDLTDQQRHHTELENRRKLALVKSCKAKYERWLKLLDLYNTLKTKNSLI